VLYGSQNKQRLFPQSALTYYFCIETEGAHYAVRTGSFNPLNAELNPICHLLALLGAHYILHVSRIRVNIIQITIFCGFSWA
jgi:hypothetical protein